MSAVVGTVLLVSEGGELPDLVSRLFFIVGNATALLCKPGVYRGLCAVLAPSFPRGYSRTGRGPA